MFFHFCRWTTVSYSDYRPRHALKSYCKDYVLRYTRQLDIFRVQVSSSLFFFCLLFNVKWSEEERHVESYITLSRYTSKIQRVFQELVHIDIKTYITRKSHVITREVVHERFLTTWVSSRRSLSNWGIRYFIDTSGNSWKLISIFWRLLYHTTVFSTRVVLFIRYSESLFIIKREEKSFKSVRRAPDWHPRESQEVGLLKRNIIISICIVSDRQPLFWCP